MKGALLDTNFDLIIKPTLDASGKITCGLVLGENTDQCAALVLDMSPGEVKEDPLLGAGLTRLVRSKYSESEVDQLMRQHLTRAGINYNEYKEKIITRINS